VSRIKVTNKNGRVCLVVECFPSMRPEFVAHLRKMTCKMRVTWLCCRMPCEAHTNANAREQRHTHTHTHTHIYTHHHHQSTPERSTRAHTHIHTHTHTHIHTHTHTLTQQQHIFFGVSCIEGTQDQDSSGLQWVAVGCNVLQCLLFRNETYKHSLAPERHYDLIIFEV